MDNPFRFGQIVENEEFCPRVSLEKQLRSNFGSGQNTVIFGERRVGKSSLIFRAAGKTRGKHLLYIDLMGIRTMEDFLTRAVHALETFASSEHILRRLLKALSRFGVSMSLDPATGEPNFSPSFRPGEVEAKNLVQLGTLWREINETRGLIVAIDEFQDILNLENSDEVLSILRSELQRMGKIPVCFAGSVRNDMLTIFNSQDSPFFKSAVSMEVERDDFDGWNEFLLKRFRKGRRKIDEACLAGIVEQVDGSPGDMQQLCAAIWERTRKGSTIDEDVIQSGLAEVFRNEQKGYELILADITAQQLNVLRALARLGGDSIQCKEFLQTARVTHASSSKAAVRRLEARRVVFRLGKRYHFTNPFLRLWLLKAGI